MNSLLTERIKFKTQTAVTCIRLNNRRTKTGIPFTDLTFRMSKHTSSEVTVRLKFLNTYDNSLSNYEVILT